MRLMTDCDVITHSMVKQTWHITTKGEAAGKYTTLPLKYGVDLSRTYLQP